MEESQIWRERYFALYRWIKNQQFPIKSPSPNITPATESDWEDFWGNSLDIASDMIDKNFLNFISEYKNKVLYLENKVDIMKQEIAELNNLIKILQEDKFYDV